MRYYAPNLLTITPTIRKNDVIEIIVKTNEIYGIFCVYVSDIISVDINTKRMKIKIGQNYDFYKLQDIYKNFHNGLIFITFTPFHKHKNLIK